MTHYFKMEEEYLFNDFIIMLLPVIIVHYLICVFLRE